MEKWRSETTEKMSRNEKMVRETIESFETARNRADEREYEQVSDLFREHLEGTSMEHMNPVFLYYCVRAGFKRGLEEEKKASRRKPRRKAPPRRLCYKCRSPEHLAATCKSEVKSDIQSSNSNNTNSDKSICDMEEKIKKLEAKVEKLENKQLDSELKVSENSKPSEMEKIETKMKELESKLSDMEKDKEIESCKDLSQPSIPVVKWPVEKQMEWSQVQLPPQLTPYPFMNRKLQTSGEMMKLRTERQESWFGPFRWKMW